MLDLSGYSFGSGAQQRSSEEQKNKFKAMRKRYIVFYILSFVTLAVSLIETLIILITGVPKTLTWLWLAVTILVTIFSVVGIFISLKFRKDLKAMGVDYSKQKLSLSTYILSTMITLTIIMLLIVKIINPELILIK